ncbi:MAG TPA: cytochrome c peroxidase [Chitinophagaceae bacterium]|nr:cytochrome c peroxidase [Chitinophagaceae bacterium]
MRKAALLLTLFIILLAYLIACRYFRSKQCVEVAITLFQKDVQLFKEGADLLVNFIEADSSGPALQQQFRKARAAWKKTEWLAEYYYPYTAKYINGPALREVEADEKTKILEPEGFQVVEELLFPYDKANRQELLMQAKILQSNAGRLKYVAADITTTDAHIFDALRLELFRIIALGISGFDSPVANNSIPEVQAALEGMHQYYMLYASRLAPTDTPLLTATDSLFSTAGAYLEKDSSFLSFNRMRFITAYLNPLSEHLLTSQQKLDIPVFDENRALKPGAPTLFAPNIFNPDYYTAGTEYHSTLLKEVLGKRLFYSGILSGDGKRSCATCHQPARAFTDGLPRSLALNGTNVLRNAPTLINAVLQPSLFYDTRVSYLEDQANEVISNKDEMHGSLQTAVKHIKSDKAYTDLFHQAFNDTVITALQVKNALACYVRSLIRLNARFDQYMRGDHYALSKKEIDGFNVFMGKAKCGTCHFTPLFNGANVPVFNKIDAEVIGVPALADTMQATIDPDEGKYNLYRATLHKHAFKTSTLRNIELTAPYMHNGVFKTLEEVVDFYDRGGGSGLGIHLPNQTLPEDRLHLSAYEKQALVAFMKALTDTAGLTGSR